MRKHIHRPNADAALSRLKAERAAEIAPPKFCKDCRWHDFDRKPTKDGYLYKHFCKFPPLLDVITGQPSDAMKNRNTETLCGRTAKHFSERAAK